MEQNKQDEVSGVSFKAFISYSHADAEVVRKLHSQLETYRLPKGLGEISSQNAGPRDLGKIFRDREYLSVAEDLSSSVKSALAQSEVLVVVCSPQAKASQWVEREIEYFRSLHADRPILAALVEGEPQEAFPAALIEGGVEPLAADLRKQGDGWKLGFLKLVAGIVGVPLDALIQRDSQRQLTRVMAVTGVVGVFALCMAAMAFIANQARNEAQFQQKEAEELVGFMMGDLRLKLESVGRLDVLEDTNQKALEYFEAQTDLGVDSPERQVLLAKIAESIGRELLRRDDVPGARARFSQAYEITEGLLQDEPTSPAYILAHAWSKTRMMTSSQQLGIKENLDLEADAILDELTLIREWGQSEPDWLRLEALANGNRCATATFSEYPEPETEQNCKRAISAGRSYARIDKTGQAAFDLAYNTFWYAQWLGKHGKPKEANEQYRSALEQTEAAEMKPTKEDARQLRQRMEILGASLSWEEPEELSNLCEAIEIGNRLLEIEPEDEDVINLVERYKERKGVSYGQCA